MIMTKMAKTQTKRLHAACDGCDDQLIDRFTTDEKVSAKAGSTRRMFHVCLMALALILLSACATASEKPQSDKLQTKVTGVFSDMRYNGEGGDVLGIEVFVTYSSHGYFVVYQSSEGEPSIPVVVPAHVSGTAISFAVPAGTDPRGAFAGTINGQELTGTFSGNQETVHLRRKASYWQ